MPESHYDSLVVLYNPTKAGSPKFKKAQEQVKFLNQSTGLRTEEVPTLRDSSKTQEYLLKIIKANSLLVVLGGDGTVNTAVHSLIRQDRDSRADLLAVPAGTANDFSKNINGNLKGQDALVKALTAGQKVQINPLQLIISNPSTGSRKLIAVNNAGIGYTAELAGLLNTPAHRSGFARRIPGAGLLIQEALTANRSMGRLRPISVYDIRHPEAYSIADRSFIHAGIAGKYGRYTVRHTDSEFLDIESPSPKKPAVITAALQSLLGRCNGVRSTRSVLVTGGSRTVGHVDGEAFDIAPNTSVEVTLSDEYIITHSLKLTPDTEPAG